MSIVAGCNWSVVEAIVGKDIPYSELPNDVTVYSRLVGAHLQGACSMRLRTAGVIRFIDRYRSMKKEGEYKAIVERLASQQQESNTRYDQLVVQYEQLLASYTAMQKAYKEETEVTRALKKQLDDTLAILKSAGIV